MRKNAHHNGFTFSYDQRSPHGAPVRLACVIPWRRDLLGTPEQGVDHIQQAAMLKYAEDFASDLAGFQDKKWKLVSASKGATGTGATAVLAEVVQR